MMMAVFGRVYLARMDWRLFSTLKTSPELALCEAESHPFQKPLYTALINNICCQKHKAYGQACIQSITLSLEWHLWLDVLFCILLLKATQPCQGNQRDCFCSQVNSQILMNAKPGHQENTYMYTHTQTKLTRQINGTQYIRIKVRMQNFLAGWCYLSLACTYHIPYRCGCWLFSSRHAGIEQGPLWSYSPALANVLPSPRSLSSWARKQSICSAPCSELLKLWETTTCLPLSLPLRLCH